MYRLEYPAIVRVYIVFSRNIFSVHTEKKGFEKITPT